MYVIDIDVVRNRFFIVKRTQTTQISSLALVSLVSFLSFFLLFAINLFQALTKNNYELKITNYDSCVFESLRSLCNIFAFSAVKSHRLSQDNALKN